MVSLATPTDRTLYFDFLPLRMPRIRGMSVRLQLFTVPGQMYFAATRKLVLAGADGVVFVADSQAARLDANRESIEDLRANLAEHGRDLEKVPHTLQYNKRDLDETTSLEELDRTLNQYAAPSRGTVATTGSGVFAGLEDIARRVIRQYESEQPRSDGAASLVPSGGVSSSEVGLEEAIRGLTDRLTHATPPRGVAAVRPALERLAEVAGATSPPPPLAAPMPSTTPPVAVAAAAEETTSGAGTTNAANGIGPVSGNEVTQIVDLDSASETTGVDQGKGAALSARSSPASEPAMAAAAVEEADRAVLPVSLSGDDEADQEVTQVFDSAAAIEADGLPYAPPAPEEEDELAPGTEALTTAPTSLTQQIMPPERVSQTVPLHGSAASAFAFSLAPLWPEAERPLVREAETMLAAADGSAAMRVCEPLVFRALAAAAMLVGGAEAPREPAMMALLLGIDGVRYLAFRIAARRARAGDVIDTASAYDALLLALEARRIRSRLDRERA